MEIELVDTIYFEESVTDHPRTREILSRFKIARKIPIQRYGEIFNKRNQNFKLQKRNPALILAKKHKGFVLPVPEGFGIGHNINFYFSHMYNCIYDCRYCFLQGMYSSANYVIFVNFEDFFNDIEQSIEANGAKDLTFFSGYDCDSLAFENITGFAESILPLFKSYPKVDLEFRTKSVQLEPLKSELPIANCIVAFSLMPEELAKRLDKKAPSIKRRVDAIEKLAAIGWPIGLRFDPLIYSKDWKQLYKGLLMDIMRRVPSESIHSISYGPLRYPKKMYQDITKLYPEELLFSIPMSENNGYIDYGVDVEQEMTEFLINNLKNYVEEAKLFQCVVQA
mgnify:CR=1 FL=1